MISKTKFESEENLINNIIENFDFDKCHKVMKFLDWRWFPNHLSVPTKSEIIDRAVKNLRETVKLSKNVKDYRSPCWISSGGFKSTVWLNKYGHIVELELEFILTSWSHDDDY